jgi:hypothetical protein
MRVLLKNGFYFRYYFDFRGRLYADSPISVTNNVSFRHCYHYGHYTKNEINMFKQKINQKDIEYFDYILKNSSLKNQYLNIDFNDNFIKYYIVSIFIELGKIYKNLIIEEKGGRLAKIDFIELGVINFEKNDYSQLDMNKQVEALSLLNILGELDKNIFKKTPLFKDATASGIQILSLILGLKNFSDMRWVNLTEESVWYDTYYFIIKTFKEKHPAETDLEKFFNRKNLKKTIMTYNYNATYLRCWKNFKKEAEINYLANEEFSKKIEDYFKQFYLFLDSFFLKNNFYKESPHIITMYFSNLFLEENSNFYKTEDEFFIALKYFLLNKKIRFDKIVGGERITIELSELGDGLNTKKTKRALQANITHAFDAFIIRYIINKLDCPLITIHDSMGVDILQTKNFEEAAREAFAHLYKLNVFSLNDRLEDTTFIKSNWIFL